MYTKPEWLESPERIQEDLEAARRVHMSLMRHALPNLPEVGLAMAYRSAWQVGGDVVDVRRRGARLALCVADVAGNGVQAALIAVAVRAWLDHVRNRFVSPAEVADQLNRLLCECLPHEMFVTLAYLVYHLKTGEARWVVAGHELPLVRRAATGAVEEVRTTGPLLGVDARATYEEARVDLDPGDVTLLYTDGLRGTGDLSATLGILRRFHGPDVNCLVADLLADAAPGDQELPDDIAMIAMQRLGG
jgi:sigma-B regulation protein RsbU (phosphoserine phosphatase)